MKHQLNISYPQHWLDAMQVTQQAFEEDAKMAMAAKMFEMKRLSSGMAAKLVGISRAQFLLSLHHYGVAMVDIEEDELKSDVENI